MKPPRTSPVAYRTRADQPWTLLGHVPAADAWKHVPTSAMTGDYRTAEMMARVIDPDGEPVATDATPGIRHTGGH